MNSLTVLQALVLKMFSNYKPFAREENYNYEVKKQDLPSVPYADVVNELVELGYLKKNKRGAVTRSTQGYEATGSYHGAEAEARRQMWAGGRDD